MEDIQVGEWIRTKSGYIARVLGKRESHSFTTNTGHKANYQEKYFIDNDKYSITKPYIKKHSKKPIDLIEVGDIVEIYDVLHNDIIYIWSEDMLKALKQDVENGIRIKTILTKEQYNSNCYRLEE